MAMRADSGPIPGDRLLTPTAPAVEDLWQLVRDQQARIERLESGLLPLPDATERENAGRRRLAVSRGKESPAALNGPLAAIEAFQMLEPVTARYAAVPIMDGFNWDECAARLATGEWYMVVFRSVRREACDDLTLEMHDYGAYIEAQRRAIGLVHYFRGTQNEQRECLSFCIWASRQEAARAARLPLHRVAMTMVEEKYEWYRLERYVLRKARGRKRLEAVAVDANGVPTGAN